MVYYSFDQVVQLLQRLRRYMLPRHARDLDPRRPLHRALIAFRGVDEHVLPEIEVQHVGERILGTLVREVILRMRGCHDGKISTEGCFHFLIEMVPIPFVRGMAVNVCVSAQVEIHSPMIMRKQNHVNSGQFVQVDGRVRSTGTRNSRAEVDVVPGVQEVGLQHHCSVTLMIGIRRRAVQAHIGHQPNAFPLPGRIRREISTLSDGPVWL